MLNSLLYVIEKVRTKSYQGTFAEGCMIKELFYLAEIQDLESGEAKSQFIVRGL
jgi:hypothetical protein